MKFSKADLDIIYKYITSKMFGDKLSDYPSVEELTGTELMPIIQNGENKNVQSSNLVTLPQLVAKFTEYSDGITALNLKLDKKIAETIKLIENLEVTGMIVMQEFGDSESFGISQKKITAAINQLWQKIEDMTGEVLQGINMVVTPEYFIGETSADIHITANTVDTNGIFEHITFYANGVLIAEADNVDFFEHDFHVDETTVIQCVAKIMGVEYTRQSIITHYSSFLLGSGDSYEDLMDANNRFLPEYAIPITNGMRGAYDVSIAESKRLIIVVGDSLKAGFIRADLNGVEIPFTESTCTDADGKVYAVFTSEPWSAGDYNIDING